MSEASEAHQNFLTLGIETSCDDTAVAVLRGDREVLVELLSSQIADHAPFGGVVPEFAARKHLENLLPLVDAALKRAAVGGKDLDLIAVTRGPGLMGSLMVGVETARALSQAWNVPLLGVNHLEGHMFASLTEADLKPPFLSLIVSGGHTEIVRVDAFGEYSLLGATRDDAAGEAYDKAAKVMGLSYPGGPEIDKLAKEGNPSAFNFPVPLKNTNQVEFSFSGLKTALLWQVHRLREVENDPLPLADLCASFQRAVTDALISKVVLAVQQTGVKQVAISGGVAANSALRKAVINDRRWNAFLPSPSRCTDNAVMVAMAGRNAWNRGVRSSSPDPDPSLEFIHEKL
ncbi:MAG: tRNA (adenosine(37)-N6)-threonylcarbamoyltransferase complex transferase subunit TsaD [Synergistaceae bacterium]|jgi:N6-L-threonylcarbamoyladenine synthase|nr:tRNA (adenosine(37)-N6)-threonylcarbamoyltransferase complex transferase subunit TsaD [Synergistaceae bacterium]